MDDNFIVQVGRTLARPWKEDISPLTAVIVVVLFAIVVWWSLDALNVINKLEKAAKSLLEEIEG